LILFELPVLNGDLIAGQLHSLDFEGLAFNGFQVFDFDLC